MLITVILLDEQKLTQEFDTKLSNNARYGYCWVEPQI